jgi:hypothetical protein
MSSPPGKIAVVQVSSGVSCNASLPSTRGRQRVVPDQRETETPHDPNFTTVIVKMYTLFGVLNALPSKIGVI